MIIFFVKCFKFGYECVKCRYSWSCRENYCPTQGAQEVHKHRQNFPSIFEQTMTAHLGEVPLTVQYKEARCLWVLDDLYLLPIAHVLAVIILRVCVLFQESRLWKRSSVRVQLNGNWETDKNADREAKSSILHIVHARTLLTHAFRWYSS